MRERKSIKSNLVKKQSKFYSVKKKGLSLFLSLMLIMTALVPMVSESKSYAEEIINNKNQELIKVESTIDKNAVKGAPRSPMDISSTNVTSLSLSSSQIYDGSKVTIHLDFNDTAGKIYGGDTINVSWPYTGDAYVQGYTKTVPLNIKGVLVGEAVIKTTGATITFNSSIDNLDDVSGWLEFEAQGRNITNTTEENTKTVSIISGSKSADLSIVKPASGTSTATFYYKTGAMYPADTEHISWFLCINNGNAYADDSIRIEDQIQPGQVLDASSISLHSIGNINESYRGPTAIADFKAAFPGSTIDYNVSTGQINVMIPKDSLSLNKITITYQTQITNLSQDYLVNNSTAWFKEYNKPAVVAGVFNHSVKNINASAGITGTVKGELKIVKVVNGTEVGIPNVIFELKREDGEIIKDGKKLIELTTNSSGIADIKGLPVGNYIAKETFAPDWIKFNPLEASELKFSVKESDIEGTLLNVVNDKKLIDVTATKVWNGGTTPRPTVYFKLYRKTSPTGTPVAVPGDSLKALTSGTTSVTWNNQYKTDNSGNNYIYSVKEVDINGDDYVPSGYSKVESGLTVTNTFLNETEVSVSKTWVGEKAPLVLVTLVADGVDMQNQILNDTNNWNFTFTGLPKYKDGNTINYTVKEQAVPGYITAITGTMENGFLVTNTKISTETKSIPVEKKWVGPAAENVVVKLMADGVEKESVTLNAANSWKHDFTNLPVYNQLTGLQVAYTVAEDAVTGYDGVITGDDTAGFIITNTNTEKVSIPVEKKWIGPATESVVVKLMADGVEKESVTLNALNQWKHDFTNLDKYDQTTGNKIVYTVVEQNIAGYTSLVTGSETAGFVIKNTNTEKRDISVEKNWVGPSTENVVVKLMADGVEAERVTLDATNSWKYDFTNLIKYNQTTGAEINYTVVEENVPGYQTLITGTMESGFTVTNTITGKTSIGVTKKWIGPKADSVNIKLLADGVETQTQTLNEANNWQYTFTNLEKYNNGQKINYTISEDALAGYESNITGSETEGYLVTNINTEKRDIPVEKQWVGSKLESVVIKLMANGVEKESVTLNEANEWKHNFTNLVKYDSATGEEIVYTVFEDELAKYTTTITGDMISGFVVTNKRKSSGSSSSTKISVDVTKKWVGEKKDSVIIKLFANGKEIKSQKLNDENNWTYKFTGLEKYFVGEPIKYTVKEVEIDGYTSKITGDMASGFVVTNTKEEDSKKEDSKKETDQDKPDNPNKKDTDKEKNPPDNANKEEVKKETTKKSSVPKTGDSFNAATYAVIIVSSLLAGTAMIIGRKKKGKHAK